MLVFSLVDNEIPSTVVGQSDVDEWKGPMAEHARSIASSPDLLSIVQDFLSD